MSDNDIAFLSASEIAKAILAGEATPINVVQAYLDRIDRLDPDLSAYITVTREEALGEAEVIAQKIKSGANPGPLSGVPIAIKDQFWTKDILTTNGSSIYQDFVPDTDSTVVERLRDAGANWPWVAPKILLGGYQLTRGI